MFVSKRKGYARKSVALWSGSIGGLSCSFPVCVADSFAFIPLCYLLLFWSSEIA